MGLIDRSGLAVARPMDTVQANKRQSAVGSVTESTDGLPGEIGGLLEVLDADYGYGLGRFAHRVRALVLPTSAGDRSPRALSFEASPGFPFLLAVATSKSLCTTHREVAIRYALETATTNTIFLYDGTTNYREALRRNFRDSRFDTVSDILPYHVHREEDLLNRYDANEKDIGRPSLPITHKLEDIFFEMHSAMRDEDGLHADEALEELCKLLHLKTSLESRNAAIDIAAPRSDEEQSALLRGLYLQSCRSKFPNSGTDRLPLSTPIRLSTSALVKAFSLLDGYTLLGTPTDVKGRAFQRVITKAARAGMGQYFTPTPVVSMMVDIVAPGPTESVIDPFCGSGHFLTRSIFRLKDDLHQDAHPAASYNIHGIEKSDRMARVAITELSLYGCPEGNIRAADALMDFESYEDIQPESFDVVLTNPPFGSILGVQAFSSLAKFALARGRKRLPLEVAGLERCAQLLKPGGRLAIVLPESIFSATSLKYVRTWLQRVFSIRIVVDLPTETFCPFGANVRSGVLFARKRHRSESRDGDERVNMIQVHDVGYDASGRAKGASDIEQAVVEARCFLTAEGW